jgi:hypothetical protein
MHKGTKIELLRKHDTSILTDNLGKKLTAWIAKYSPN